MCTLALFTRALPGLPLVIAANRDEFYARPATGPVRLDLVGRHPRAATIRASESEGRLARWIVGGLDLVAGGSWLGVSSTGLVVGILNRRTGVDPDPTRRSRGEICLALAGEPSAAEAAGRLGALSPHLYNPFNVVVADRDHAFLAQNLEGRMFVRSLEPGVHVVTNLDLNDPRCPRVSRSAVRFEAVAREFARRPDSSELLCGLRRVLADHTWDRSDPARPYDPLCIHGPAYGTRSSSLICVRDDGALTLHHAAAAPCRTPHRRVELPALV